ncbi:MAG: hypothetical protein QFB87_04045 [Patescibacteria group bacterium]|nr:hypothetical protein [Patescibacteria group bacterium]
MHSERYPAGVTGRIIRPVIGAELTAVTSKLAANPAHSEFEFKSYAMTCNDRYLEKVMVLGERGKRRSDKVGTTALSEVVRAVELELPALSQPMVGNVESAFWMKANRDGNYFGLITLDTSLLAALQDEAQLVQDFICNDLGIMPSFETPKFRDLSIFWAPPVTPDIKLRAVTSYIREQLPLPIQLEPVRFAGFREI